MKAYFKWPYSRLERRSGTDRRINPLLIADPEERKEERRKEIRRSGIMEGFVASLISRSKTSCEGTIRMDTD